MAHDESNSNILPKDVKGLKYFKALGPLKELADQLPNSLARKQSKGYQEATLDRLSSLGKTITAVDGSIVQILARIAKLAWITVGDGEPTCGYRQSNTTH